MRAGRPAGQAGGFRDFLNAQADGVPTHPWDFIEDDRLAASLIRQWAIVLFRALKYFSVQTEA
jgi:hypothetical protein